MSEKVHLSAIVITQNEERNIVDCLQSITWADEIVVVDARSTDRTVELAMQFTPKVYVTDWLGYGPAKNFALERSTNGWVLWLDADERVTPELAEEIQTIVSSDSKGCNGYDVARKAYFLGKWIRHCGWYPGYVIRLFRRGSARFSSSNVHEKIETDGQIGRLENDLIHHTDENLFHYFAKFNRYTTLAAKDVAAAHRTFSLYDVMVRPSYLFCKMYLLRLGFLDGIHGLVLSLLSAAYVFTKYAKVWEIEPGSRED